MNNEYQPQLELQQTEPSPIPAPVKKTFLRYSNKPAKDFFDKFRHEKLCTIPATTHYKKKDVFLAVRPKEGTCLDYHISETDTKLEAGTTKIHIRQVTATYEPLPPNEPEAEVPPPPKKRKRNPFHNKYCHARGAVVEFAEEKYARKVKREQEYYKRKLEEGIGIVKNKKNFKKYNEHDYLLELCGPDWFIELSPIQKKAVDNLLDAIQHDLRFGEVTETCCILGRLGLLLRPNRKLVEIALKNSCKCPVEFLLTLYQLMNPNRKFYSLNDMLILSSVVHLTLRSTLKEMHIRLPSPPPPLERKATKPKRPKKCTYESPYLEPVLFIRSKPPETLKHGYLTFPKSPYFAYLKELHELRYPAYSTRSRFRLFKEKDSSLPVTSTLYNELLAAQAAYNKMHEYYEHEKVNLLQASIYYNYKKQMQSTTDRNYFDCNTESGEKDITEDFNTTLVATISKFEDTTVELTVEMTVTEELDEKNNRTMDMCECQVEQGSTSESDVASNSSDPILDNGHIVPAEEMNNVDEGACISTHRSSEGSTTREIDKAENKEERGLVEIKKRAPSNCICRQVIEKRIEESTCQCMKCKQDREKKNIKTTYVIYDTKIDLDGPIPIISDVKAERKCICLERYMKKVNRIDYKKEIRRAHEHLIDMGQPFIINGVSIGPDGKPIYNLSAGVAVKSKCRCLTQPKPPDATKTAAMPMGRQKYAISGIQSSPDGNVFIVSGALPIEPCCCMEMYKEYVREHDICLQLYEAYLNKIKYDTDEYMDDLRNHNIVEDAESRTSSSVGSDEQPFECVPITETADESIVPAMNKSSDHVDEKQVCNCKDEEEAEEEEEEVVEEEEEEAAAEEEEEAEEDILSEYSRYIILKHNPTNKSEQIDVIKQLLHLLAQDDYPLAKLPDCHKLPIFKLWMVKKMRLHWTYNDRLRTLEASKGYWCHILHCRANLARNITLGLTNTDANNFTWLDSKIVKDYTSKRRCNYQSQQRQASVAAAREFFPSLFMYENYSTRFRDVFFAYMPSKEEDVFYHNVWKMYEYRNLLKSRQAAKVYRCSMLV